MKQYVIVESNNKSVLAYSQGDIMRFANKETAENRAGALRHRNSGEYTVKELGPDHEGWKLVKAEGLVVTPVRPYRYVTFSTQGV
jgi:hypothetical protein